MPPFFDLDTVIASFHAEGWARLGRIADEPTLAAMRARADAIMDGAVPHAPFFFQHDAPTGRYDDLTLAEGWIGPSRAYRKIEKLERDPVFRAHIESPALEPLVRAVVGDDVVLYRAVLWTKAAEGGTDLPFHQDAGTFWGLDRDPILQVWTALDDAPKEAGCVEIVPRTHLAGRATPLGGVVPAPMIARHDADARALAIEAAAGDAILIHNHVWHRSGRNRTRAPRRALSVCYMPASTRCLRVKRAPRTFVPLFVRAPFRDR